MTNPQPKEIWEERFDKEVKLIGPDSASLKLEVRGFIRSLLVQEGEKAVRAFAEEVILKLSGLYDDNSVYNIPLGKMVRGLLEQKYGGK